MKKQTHRLGVGFNPRAPTGLMEHSIYGDRMEQAFQQDYLNKFFEILIRLSTSDMILNLARHAAGGKLIKIPKAIFDILCVFIDKLLVKDRESRENSKAAFLGKVGGFKYRSGVGGYFLELMSKYLQDWTKRQIGNIRIEPPKRKMNPVKKTYFGWKRLRDSVQPSWAIFPKDPEDIVKILPEDRMSPRDRIENIVKGKKADRVGLGLTWDWGIPFMGGSNAWKFCYDGIETGWAALNVWIRIGGADFLPSSTGIAAYSIPFPDAHSRFFFKWGYPSDDIPPQCYEVELLKSYEDLYNYGMMGLAQEISKRMIRDMFILVREFLYLGRVTGHYFSPFEKQFFPNPGAIFSVWDILPMWRSVIPFVKDMRKNPEAVIEAFEFLNKPLTNIMIFIAKLTKAKVALIGNSRGSNSFISPKMFEELFWPSMKYTFERCFENKIIPLCHFDNDWTENMVIFAEKLPKRSCIFHLDQVDLVKVHDLIGDHFCLMGGMSPSLLVHGAPLRVEEVAKRYIENIGEDGLIISSGCEIPFDIPIQNIYALKRAIKKYGTF